MNEIFDRPNKPGIWQRESDGCLMHVYRHNAPKLRVRCIDEHTCAAWDVEDIPADRYRIRTIPDEPWPPKVRIEKRRRLEWINDDGHTVVIYKPAGFRFFVHPETHVVSDEIRDCKIGEDGKVASVIPFKEGE